jgi:hypothetical protein
MSLAASGLTREVVSSDGATRTVFADVSLQVAPGEALFVVGCVASRASCAAGLSAPAPRAQAQRRGQVAAAAPARGA